MWNNHGEKGAWQDARKAAMARGNPLIDCPNPPDHLSSGSGTAFFSALALAHAQ